MYYSAACSVPDPFSTTVIMTGGTFSMNTVSRYGLGNCTVLYRTVLYCRYGLEGWLEDLPPLNVGRREHGCGSYVSDGELVSALLIVCEADL